MNTIKSFLLTASFLPVVLFGQVASLSHRAGVSAELGFSNLFLGSNAFSAAYAQPLLGGGGGLTAFYEMQYRRLLFRTGLGFDYTGNRNRLTVPDFTAHITEYPDMTWHYHFSRYTEMSNYGTLFLPVMVGGEFNRWFFLAGVKLGVIGFGNTYPVTQATIWAEDPDVIEPLQNLYTHALTDYTFKGGKKKADWSPFNLMGSLEVGMNIGKQPEETAADGNPLNAAELYKQMHEKKSFVDCLRYRVSLFVDYGFSNLLAKHTATEELLAFQSVNEITPRSIYDYKEHKGAVLNNFLIGVKFAVAYEIPRKAPKTGDLANPLIVTYVSDKQTGQPIAHAKVVVKPMDTKEKSAKSKKHSSTSYTDSIAGGTSASVPAGKYRISASHAGYKPKRIKFTHRDRYDTVRIALTIKQEQQVEEEPLTLRSQAVDMLTGRPVNARVTISDEQGEIVAQTTLDSITTVAAVVIEEDKQYTICAEADGYKDTCTQVTDAEEVQIVQLEPVKIRKFVLKNMFFATDKTQILTSSEEALLELYKLLSDNPDIRIRIIGHTDDVGTVEYNQRLSEGRSASVKQEMVKRGIAEGRIETAGHGELDPIVVNDSDEHRQMNRRVEIEILTGEADNLQISNQQLVK